MGIVGMDIAHQGLLQVMRAVEAVGFQNVAEAAVEAFRCPAMVCGDFGGVRRCSMANSAQSRSKPCSLMRLGRRPGRQGIEIAHAMPPKTEVQPRARHYRIEKLSRNRQKIIQWKQ